MTRLDQLRWRRVLHKHLRCKTRDPPKLCSSEIDTDQLPPGRSVTSQLAEISICLGINNIEHN
jgi:hypothetical protein